ncbi:MAG: hypothetical protein GF331_00720, partial [Chitinivibrionales bacterium]|nr:hypothetical protein [Chitinivibrionales bacterium]
MRVSSSDPRVRTALKYRVRCAALRHFHDRDGRWQNGRYTVTLLERFGWFRWMCDHLRYQSDDFTMKRPVAFLMRFVKRAAMLLACPFATIALSVYAPMQCALEQARAVKARNSEELLPETVALSRLSMATAPIAGPLVFGFEFLFGPLLERWGMSMLWLALLWPFALLIFVAQTVVFALGLLLAPVVGLGFGVWYVVKPVGATVGEHAGRLFERVEVGGVGRSHSPG